MNAQTHKNIDLALHTFLQEVYSGELKGVPTEFLLWSLDLAPYKYVDIEGVRAEAIEKCRQDVLSVWNTCVKGLTFGETEMVRGKVLCDTARNCLEIERDDGGDLAEML